MPIEIRGQRRSELEDQGLSPELTGGVWDALQLNPDERVKLALDLANQEYHHPESEAAGAKEEQRSFCLCHKTITAQSVLLIHGFTACPYEMRELGQFLHGQGWNVFGTRLAGHGTKVADLARSTGRDWLFSSRKGLAIAALLGRETMVVGESMGGTLAILLARDYPRLISKMVLCAPCLRIANRMAPLSKFWIVRRFIPENDMGVQYEWQFDYWYRKIPTRGVAELVRLAETARKAGRALTVPTCIIQALDDKIVRPSGADSFYKSLVQLEPNRKKIVNFNQGHHNLTIDLNPRKREVFEWIYRFCLYGE